MRHAIASMTVAALMSLGSAALADAQSKGRGSKPTPTAHGPKTTASQVPKTTAARGPKTTGSHRPKAAKPAARTKTNAQTSATNLPRNPRLVERLRLLLDLPPGTDMTAVASGFKNQGQFVAAVHVSNNLGLTFSELKTLMVDHDLSLGQAIHKLRAGVNANNEVRRATSQSRQ